MAKIVILGAGLTGISAAYHLEQLGFTNYKLFEKESTPGGLCKSVQQDGFTFDYTGHLLHINDPYFEQLIRSVIGLHNFNAIARKSAIYSHGVYTGYPFQSNLYGLPENVIVDCITGFVNKRTTNKPPKSFIQWAHNNFGTGFAKHFFIPYQTKIFAYDVANITASWTGRFVPSTTLEQIIRGTIADTSQKQIGYNANFYYPKKDGIFYWVNKLTQQIKQPIYTNCTVKTVDTKEKTVTFTNGHIERFDRLINTMPLTTLLDCLQEKNSTRLKRARNKLLCNSVINFNLGISKPNISKNHWLYYPETKYPFYRIGFPYLFAKSMAPHNCSSLYGELAYLPNTGVDTQQLATHAVKTAKQLLNITDADIATECIIDIPHAYVLYTPWRDKHLPQLLSILEKQSVYCAGRYAQWKYASMQEAVLDGKSAAQTVLTTTQKNQWKTATISSHKQPYREKPAVTKAMAGRQSKRIKEKRR